MKNLPFRFARPLAALLAGAAALAVQAQNANPTAEVVEYYNTITKHYFITGLDVDKTAVDSGAAGAGWVRTGVTWGAYKAAADGPNLQPVCRFYAAAPNSHFYTAIASECAAVKTYPGWVYEGISHYTEVPTASNGTACRSGTLPIYRVYNNRFQFNDSNHRFTLDAAYAARAKSRGESAEGVVMCAPVRAADAEADNIRLLKQATFGPTEASIERVNVLGAAAWLDEQFNMAASSYPNYTWWPDLRPDTCIDDRTLPITAASFCQRDNYTLYPLQRQFFIQALSAEDQLRQRVGFALSQILVTSGTEIPLVYAMAGYQQALRNDAFGNFEKLLNDVTLSPVMGKYLDMANNRAATNGVQPNENYARELMQLFAIGTYKLNLDGTIARDASGAPLAAYTQTDVMELTRALTGYTYPTVTGATVRAANPVNYQGPMIPSITTTLHDGGAKSFLGSSIAAGGTAAVDVAAAVRIVFNHPNVGPFIAKQLIQKLVTSDPTPEYVARVATVFNNNGSNVRGDLRAVVRAILLDAEARGPRKVEPTFGKLKEPALYITGILRALFGSTDGVYPRNVTAGLSQNLFYSPTVFNYYPPDYLVPGSGTLGPEFGLQDSTTAIARINVANALIMGGSVAADSTVFGATGTSLDLAGYQALASNPGAMVDKLSRIFLAGSMTTRMRSSIVTAVSAIAATDTTTRARTAAYLMASSSAAQVDR